MWLHRVLNHAVFGFTALTMLLAAGPALAQAPSNDLVENATEVTLLPFEDTVDTNAATRSPEDPWTYYGGAGPTVWYKFTADREMLVEFTASPQDFSASLSVHNDPDYGFITASYADPGGTASLYGYVYPGDTYWFMIEDTYWSENRGGTVDFSIKEYIPPPPPPPAEVNVAVDPVGSVDPKTGIAWINLDVSSSEPIYDMYVYVTLTQRSGRSLFESWNGSYQSMVDGRVRIPFEMKSSTGLYSAGKADVSVYLNYYDPGSGYGSRELQQSVQLKGKK